METQDPIASLSSNKLSERAAAARDLSRVGRPELLERLVDLAQRDPSPAVRLTVASAAADILSRYRVGPRAAELDATTRRELFGLIRCVDPGVNAGFFSMLACLGMPEAFQQIAMGLRDPRGGVRVGAAVGLMRLCMSIQAMGNPDLERQVVELLRDRRLKPDALAEVARVCSAVGYRSARPILAELALSGVHGEAVSTALDVLAATAGPLQGAWASDGLDAGEVNPEGQGPRVIWAVSESGVVEATEDGWRLIAEGAPSPLRRMFIRRAGEPEPGPALQLLGRTFYRAGEADLLETVDQGCRADALRGDDLPAEDTVREEDRIAAAALVPELVEGGPALRARGILLARAGRRAEAAEALEQATQAKRAPADTWFLYGELLLALGRGDEARPLWETFLKKEKRKRAPHVEAAAARLEGIPAA